MAPEPSVPRNDGVAGAWPGVSPFDGAGDEAELERQAAAIDTDLAELVARFESEWPTIQVELDRLCAAIDADMAEMMSKLDADPDWPMGGLGGGAR